MAIAEGQFNSIGDKITIKVDKKTGDNNNLLENVIVFFTKNNKNTSVIKAKTGELASSKKTNTLQLILHDGNIITIHIQRILKNVKKDLM